LDGLLDIQRGSKKVEDGKSLSDYITEYQIEARNDSIHKFAVAIGVDEAQLRAFMDRGVNQDNINEFGLFDRLKDTVDKSIAKAYFEKIEGQPIKMFKIPAKVDQALRRFILSEG